VCVAVRLALAAAVVVMASPYLARPLRYVGWVVVGVGAVAAIALGTALPIGMVAAFAVGVGSAAVVHLLFGSPAGRLTLGQVAEALAGRQGRAASASSGVKRSTQRQMVTWSTSTPRSSKSSSTSPLDRR
jgi:hypothetical protein